MSTGGASSSAAGASRPRLTPPPPPPDQKAGQSVEQFIHMRQEYYAKENLDAPDEGDIAKEFDSDFNLPDDNVRQQVAHISNTLTSQEDFDKFVLSVKKETKFKDAERVIYDTRITLGEDGADEELPAGIYPHTEKEQEKATLRWCLIAGKMVPELECKSMLTSSMVEKFNESESNVLQSIDRDTMQAKIETALSVKAQFGADKTTFNFLTEVFKFPRSDLFSLYVRDTIVTDLGELKDGISWDGQPQEWAALKENFLKVRLGKELDEWTATLKKKKLPTSSAEKRKRGAKENAAAADDDEEDDDEEEEEAEEELSEPESDAEDDDYGSPQRAVEKGKTPPKPKGGEPKKRAGRPPLSEEQKKARKAQKKDEKKAKKAKTT